MHVDGSIRLASGNNLQWDSNAYTAIAGSVPTSTTGSLMFYTGDGGERMRIDANGLLGLGTSSPSNQFEIQKQQNPAGAAGTSLGLGVYLSTGVGSEHNSFIQSYNGQLLLNPLGNNVGISTTTPQNKLNVVGDINATGSIYSQGINLTAITSSGYVTEIGRAHV